MQLASDATSKILEDKASGQDDSKHVRNLIFGQKNSNLMYL